VDEVDFINVAYSPIANGDVEYDRGEREKRHPRRSIPLGQPCDVAIRNNGKRALNKTQISRRLPRPSTKQKSKERHRAPRSFKLAVAETDFLRVSPSSAFAILDPRIVPPDRMGVRPST